jgi:hypothetical protein
MRCDSDKAEGRKLSLTNEDMFRHTKAERIYHHKPCPITNSNWAFLHVIYWPFILLPMQIGRKLKT